MRAYQSTRPRRLLDGYRSGTARLSLLALVAMAALGLLLVPAQADPAPAPMTLSWLDDVIDTLDDVVDDLDDAADEAEASQRNLARLDAYLNRALYKIDDLLAPDVYPSFDEGITGTIDTSVNPETLAEYGERTVALALEAFDEASTGGGFDQEYVASKLRTIVYLITRDEPHNYKTKAGI